MKLVDKIFKRTDWYITSPFGYRESIDTPNGVTDQFHNGCDYGTYRQKWAQYGIEDGEVINCGTANDGANYVWINYPRINKKILHYHLDSIKVNPGQKVTDQTIIGYTGKTGMATGIHLHLAMQDSNGNVYQDPNSYNYIPKTNKIDLVDQYIVKEGDTLSEIAEKYGVSWKTLYDLNKNIIGNNPNIIKPGQVLQITNNKQYQETYTVQEGDTLSEIAEKYGISWKTLYDLNKNIIGNNPNIIKPGQILKLNC